MRIKLVLSVRAVSHCEILVALGKLGCRKVVASSPPHRLIGGKVSIVRFDGSKVHVNVKTKKEASLAIREIKLKKKEFQLEKKQLRVQQTALRASYTHASRTRSPLWRGRGGIAGFIRLGQTNFRNAARADLAHGLAPLEDEVQKLENRIVGLDSLVLQLESFILQQSS